MVCGSVAAQHALRYLAQRSGVSPHTAVRSRPYRTAGIARAPASYAEHRTRHGAASGRLARQPRVARGGSASEPDAPSIQSALKEKLGLGVVPARDPIEVLVVDSIERPTPN